MYKLKSINSFELINSKRPSVQHTSQRNSFNFQLGTLVKLKANKPE